MNDDQTERESIASLEVRTKKPKPASNYSPIVVFDFDGVIHSYTSGWCGANVVPDGMVLGAINAMLAYISAGFKVAVHSSRSCQTGGIEAMKEAILKWAIVELGEPVAQELINVIEFPLEKPPAWLTIDDRAFAFQGVFPTVDYVKNFKPWNKVR